MKCQSSLLLIIISAISFLVACNQTGNVLKLDHTNFTNEIATDQNLIFTFANNLVPDSLMGRWDTTEYLSFHPAVKGKFKWNNTNELLFSPLQPFAPSTDFEAELKDPITRYQHLTLPKEKKIKFHTPYLIMGGVQVFYSASQQHPGAIEIRTNVSFNCQVQPEELSKRLHIFVNEKEVSFTMLSGNPDYSIGVAIADLRGESKETMPLKVIIEKGLPCVGSSYTSKDQMEFTSEIPTKEKLMVTEMVASYTNGEAVVNVFTNQPVINENIASLVSVNPEVVVTVEKLDNGFALKGNFESDKSYAITLSKMMKGIFGSTLTDNYSQSVSFGALEPMITFADVKGLYLSARGAGNIAINTASVSKIKVSVTRIYQNNILAFVRSGEQYGYDEEDLGSGEYDYHDYRYYDAENFGDLVSEKNYDVSALPRKGNLRLLNLNLNDLGYNGQWKGMYLLKIQDADRQWLQQSKFISLSDIGLMVRQGDDEIYVFANSILTAEAINNVKINFISTNNQTVGSVYTGNDGVAVLKNAKSVLGKFRLGMITCMQDQDFNFMILNNSRVETARYDVSGKYTNETHLDAFSYGEREIYRPGDSVHLNTIVRTDDWKVMRDLPMKIKLLLPSGKEYLSFKKITDAQGAFETSFFLPPSLITGIYTIEVMSGNDVYISGTQFSVEEFVPDRIKVMATLNRQVSHPEDTITSSITALNLFGPPASNRKYEMELQLKRKDFYSKKYSGYHFSIQTGEKINIESEVRNGKTDDQGKAEERFVTPAYHDIGILNGSIFTTVFDETGRPVHQYNEFVVNTQDVFYGIKRFDAWVNTRQPLALQFISCNASGQAVSATATVRIYRHEWQNVIEGTGGRYAYHSQRKDLLVSTQNISLSSSGGNVSFTPVNSGEYEVRLSRPGADTYVSLTFFAYGWGDTENTSFEVSNEGEVEMQADKESYSVGDKADILLKSPFDGKILVTVERNNVMSYYYCKTERKAASITIPVKEEFLPNVYITATAIKNVAGNEIPLTVARGYLALNVTAPETRLPITITAEAVSRSKSRQHIIVKSSAGASLTIAVVDEGILQLKNTLTPDPYDYFYQQRALQVLPFDLYPFLLPEYSAAYSSATGGDLAEAMNRRTNPFTIKRFNLVSLWSRILKANGDGEASFDITIPQFSGALRVMAVAYKDNSFGSAEKMMKVADPIVISTAMPRFLAPKDTIRVPVTLSNTTSKTATVTAQLSVTGPLQLTDSRPQSVTLKANSEGQAEFSIVTTESLGAASVSVLVTGMGEKFSDKTDIAVRPSSTLTKQTGSGMITGGKSETLSLKANMFPGTMDAKLVISKSPMAEFSKDLRYLIQYPYGCVEQTVSAAFPQLYYRDLAKAIGEENRATVYNPDYNVQQAIKKIEGMQLYNGAISFWPGGDYESWWGTAYAAHFLFEAKKAGFEVNQQILDKIYAYLQVKIKGRETELWYYQDENDISRSKTVWKRETIYSMFVLALAGHYDQPAMNYYKANREMLTQDARYVLAATFYLSGNPAGFKELLPAAWSAGRSQRAFDGSFYSDVRDQALALYVLIEADPSDPQAGIMSRHLSEQLRHAGWLSTQERAFSFLALGKMARKASQSNVTASSSVNGKAVGTFNGNDLTITKGLAGQVVNIQTSGDGNLYYFWEVSGIDVSGKIKEEDNYLKVRKEFYNRSGQLLTRNDIHQNDMIVVKLTLRTEDYNAAVENVALTDLLPAGFEIENPRISAVPDLAWIKDPAAYDYMDIRDDRITFFCTATPKEKNYYYVARAVSKGLFHMGPVSADAMYNGEYHSYWGAGVINVK